MCECAILLRIARGGAVVVSPIINDSTDGPAASLPDGRTGRLHLFQTDGRAGCLSSGDATTRLKSVPWLLLARREKNEWEKGEAEEEAEEAEEQQQS